MAGQTGSGSVYGHTGPETASDAHQMLGSGRGAMSSQASNHVTVDPVRGRHKLSVSSRLVRVVRGSPTASKVATISFVFPVHRPSSVRTLCSSGVFKQGVSPSQLTAVASQGRSFASIPVAGQLPLPKEAHHHERLR